MQAQRILIAAALACGTAVLTADLVLTALAGGAVLLLPEAQKPEENQREKPQHLSF
ncbi:hypothetical protein H0O03_01065 [Candidatus Micrarchaeota archaeon]|nr:hypothetical protein [Candidatus Micrarchaeota archaeon]